MRVDYSPCRVDLAALRAGKYVELVNLVPWKVNSSFLASTSNINGLYQKRPCSSYDLSSKGHPYHGRPTSSPIPLLVHSKIQFHYILRAGYGNFCL